MKIRLKKELRCDFEEIEIREGLTLEELYNQYVEELPYRVLAGKVNNRFVYLGHTLQEGSQVEFIDMRTQAANIIYQNSLSLLYLKAVSDVLGTEEVDIENALNKGLYTVIRRGEPITEEEVSKIQKRMEELVRLDLPILREDVGPEEAAELFKKLGSTENLYLIEKGKAENLHFYCLDDYKGFFYSLMVTSTKYIEYFEVMKYKNGVLIRFPHPLKPDEIPEYVDERVLYKTFGEQYSWGKLMGIKYVTHLNKQIEEGKAKELILLSEALHEQKIIEIAKTICQEKKRIILIAGPSSSGKTTFAQRLCIQLRVNGLNPLYMGTDDYFVERENTPLDEFGEKNYEDIEAVDVTLFNRNMNELLAGKVADLPRFDFMKGHKHFGERLTSIRKDQPIVIEGIHGLNSVLTAEIPAEEKFKIYISPLTSLNLDSHNRIVTTDHRMLRRMVRDYKYRGHSAESTLSSWASVRKGEDKNIFPYANEADVMFNSVHLYEICVLKKYAEPLLKSVTAEKEEYGDAVRMLSVLEFFRSIDDDSPIANNSIIREFIGGSIFVD